jgi:hypothetical protein
MKKKNIGTSFDSWLREEGMYEEVTATAIRRVLARQVEAAKGRLKIGRRLKTCPTEQQSRNQSTSGEFCRPVPGLSSVLYVTHGSRRGLVCDLKS